MGGERLTFHIGASYMTGMTCGGIYGVYEGFKSSVGERQRIRTNAVLNAAGRHGPGLANSLGCVAMMWSVFDSLAVTVRGTDDMFNPVGAAAVTGLIFKSGAGARVAGASGLGLVRLPPSQWLSQISSIGEAYQCTREFLFV